MSGKHTPGPWSIIDGFVAGYKEDHLGNPVANCVCYVSGSSDDHDANLSLIMSAPDLLEALEEIVKHQDIISGPVAHLSTTRNIAMRAIQKATGENK